MTRRAATQLLNKWLPDRGYWRLPSEKRQKKESSQSYKKGYEVRFVASDKAEIKQIQEMLEALDMKGGKPFPKASQWVVPVYGRAQVEEILELIGEL